MKNSEIKKLINLYKKENLVSDNTSKYNWNYLKTELLLNLETLIKARADVIAVIFSAIITILIVQGSIHTTIQRYIHWYWAFLIFIALSFIIYGIFDFITKTIEQRLTDMDFILMRDDYIVNMIQLLGDSVGKEQDLVFAMGLNETIINNWDVYGKGKADVDNYNYLNGVTGDFYHFMKKYFGLNIIEEILIQVNKENYKLGNTLFVKYNLPLSDLTRDEFRDLAADVVPFTVAYYINSSYPDALTEALKNDEPLKAEETKVDPRITVIGLMYDLSKYFHDHLLGMMSTLITMIPAIGTGEGEKGQIDTVLLEILNSLSEKHMTRPNVLVLSIQNKQLYKNQYEVLKIKKLANMILNR